MSVNLTFHCDPRTRFPLMEVPGQHYAIFWLPLTKVQIEYFLSDTLESQFDRAWYQECLKVNPRVTAENLTPQNLMQAFLTYIDFYEARTFSQWYGEGFDLPTVEEWLLALNICEQEAARPAVIEQILALRELHPRARQLVQACEKALPTYQRLRDPSQRRLSHQMMLNAGMLEYVAQDTSYTRCAACGTATIAGQTGQTTRGLRHPNTGDRITQLGVRPIWRRRDTWQT